MFTKARHWFVLMLIGPVVGLVVMYELLTHEHPGDLRIMGSAIAAFALVFVVPLKALRGMLGVWRTRRRARIWQDVTRQSAKRRG